MGTTALVAINLIGNSSQAVAAISATTASLGKLEGVSMKAAAGMAAAAYATAACVKQASLLEQAEGAVNVIFGEQADLVMEWAEGMVEFGMSTSEAAAAAAYFGGALLGVGIPMDQTLQLTKGLVDTALDMVAVYGGTLPEAITALGGVFRGEYDSLDQYNIQINASAVAAEAARLSAEGLTFASEEQAKAVAGLSLVYQATIPIQDAAETEQDQFRAATEECFAAIRNLAALIGGIFLPILTPLIQAIANTVTAVTNLIKESELLQAIMQVVADVLLVVQEILTPELTNAISAIVDAFQRLCDLLEPIVLPILEAISDALDTISQAIETVCGWIATAIQAFQDFVDAIGDAWDALTFWNNNAEVEEPTTAAINTFNRTFKALSQPGQLASGQSSITVHVHGSIDPEATARAIRKTLNDSSYRRGKAWSKI